MADSKDDAFFGEEATDQFASAFDPNAEEGAGAVMDSDAGQPKRKSIPSWAIIAGAFVIVAAGMGGMALYRSKTAPTTGVPMPIQSVMGSTSEPPPTGLVAQPAAAPQPVVAIVSPAQAEQTLPSPSPQTQSGAVSAVPSSATPAPSAPAPVAPVVVAAKEDDVAALSKRVSDLETRLDAMSKRAMPPAQQKGAPAPTVSTPKPKVAAVSDKKSAAAATSSSSKSEPKAALAGLRLRNITEGQAWIEDADGRTAVVGVGDSIAGAKITRINPDAFRVDTDRGPVIFAPTHQ